jgi:hypothetical protein
MLNKSTNPFPFPYSIFYASYDAWKTFRGKFFSLSTSRFDHSDPHLIFEISGYLAEKYNLNDTDESATRVSLAPEKWRYIAPLVRYITEVENGGHHQFFWNTGGSYNQLVKDGLFYYQMHDFLENFQKSLDVYHSDESMATEGLDSIRSVSKAFSKSAKYDLYSDFDDFYYERESVLEETIRVHFTNFA